jgi:hypothetical protein
MKRPIEKAFIELTREEFLILHKHCIPKQKVKDAIQKEFNLFASELCVSDLGDLYSFCNRLLSELGLDKNE